MRLFGWGGSKDEAAETPEVVTPAPASLTDLYAPAPAQAVRAGSGGEWPEYEDAETGAVLRAYQRQTPGLLCTEHGDFEMEAGDYLVAPAGGGRRLIKRAVFEARFTLRRVD
jgi:hypothetical protein